MSTHADLEEEQEEVAENQNEKITNEVILPEGEDDFF
jgi:hypothetical protein